MRRTIIANFLEDASAQRLFIMTDGKELTAVREEGHYLTPATRLLPHFRIACVP